MHIYSLLKNLITTEVMKYTNTSFKNEPSWWCFPNTYNNYMLLDVLVYNTGISLDEYTA